MISHNILLFQCWSTFSKPVNRVVSPLFFNFELPVTYLMVTPSIMQPNPAPVNPLVYSTLNNKDSRGKIVVTSKNNCELPARIRSFNASCNHMCTLEFKTHLMFQIYHYRVALQISLYRNYCMYCCINFAQNGTHNAEPVSANKLNCPVLYIQKCNPRLAYSKLEGITNLDFGKK